MIRSKPPERRKFIRIEVPLKVLVFTTAFKEEVSTKNISPIGMCFQIGNSVHCGDILGLSIFLPGEVDPISAKGRVVWLRTVSSEDKSPMDAGIDVIEIAERSKIALLRYLCDLLYKSSYKHEW
jgi:hypothetical protein